MTSILRQLQAEWNLLVPAAQERGVPRVRRLNAPLETIAYRREKLEWLRALLAPGASFDAWTWGVELECILPNHLSRTAIAQLITDAGVPCSNDDYNHTTRTYWKIVRDGSLSGSGCEVVSPVLRSEEGFRQLRIVCKVLTNNRARISKKCGFHVHVGAQTQGIDFFRRLAKLYNSAQPAISSFLAPSRQFNLFCRPLRINADRLEAANSLDMVAQAIGQVPGTQHVRGPARYKALSFMSFWQHGTVEFRQHQGTVDATKAENWVRLCLRMAATAASEEKLPQTVAQLLEDVGATQLEKDYFTGREAFFAGRR